MTSSTIPSNYVSLCIAGRSRFNVTVAGGVRTYDCVPGSMFVARSSLEHFTWQGSADFLHVYPRAKPQAAALLSPLREHSNVHEPNLRRLLLLYYREAASGWSSGSDYSEALLNSVLASLQAHYAEEKARIVRNGLAQAKAAATVSFIKDNLSEDIEVKHLAARSDISVSRFAVLFTNTFGMTPHQYIMHERIKQSSFLLRNTSEPVAQIAQMSGFADQSHFTRIFKRAMKTTPAKFRRATPPHSASSS